MKYACIKAHELEFEIVLMCRVLSVSRSGFYAWKKRPPSQQARAKARLRIEVHVAHRESSGRYGSPRIHEVLKQRGVPGSLNSVELVMREEGLRGRHKRQFRVTTDSSHKHGVAPNLLARGFEPVAIPGLDRVWVADLTYIPTREGWLYLAVIIDLASRFVVGWSMSTSLGSTIAIDALNMALQRRRPAAGMLHHSDRGVQYASKEYRDVLVTHGARASMSRKRNCWDNAVAESFFASLKRELVEGAHWHTRAQATRALFQFIEVWYNRNRLHSSLGYRSPASYEQQLQIKQTAA